MPRDVKAEEKIQEALLSGATELTLTGELSTSELPESLRHFTELRKLYLSHNQLTTLPEWLGQLTELRLLDLSQNKLTLLPASLNQLKNLSSLRLVGNQLTSLPESLKELTSLELLDLSHNKFTLFPEWLSQFKRLESLDLGGSHLHSLPEWIGQIGTLLMLGLSNNGLTAVPELLKPLTQLQKLDLSGNSLVSLPTWLSQFTKLQSLQIHSNRLGSLPEWLGSLNRLNDLPLYNNQITSLPDSFGNLTKLITIYVGDSTLGGNPLRKIPNCIRKMSGIGQVFASNCELDSVPEWLAEFTRLEVLYVMNNRLTDLPRSLGELESLTQISIKGNPLNPELAAADNEGVAAVKRYLRAKAQAQVALYEAKLILVGEGEVGKSCLLGALRGDPWVQNRDTTHGIEIKPVFVADAASGKEITLNGWDFGGQRVYRPTHQLFFSAPAAYLVVWKPREGPQQGFVQEWIRLIKHREPEAKIIVVATHGGPGKRQPDIDRQGIEDTFGKETIVGFFHVESQPDNAGVCRGVDELREAIATVASGLPEMGRQVPARWQRVREALRESGEAYLSLARVFEIAGHHEMDPEETQLFLKIAHRLGHLIYYEHDPTLHDLVILKPDWLATAISFVLDDEETRKNHGLASFQRLGQLWNDPKRNEDRYSEELHPVFLRLMERFDLSYRVVLPSDRPKSESLLKRSGTSISDALSFFGDSDSNSTSLIAQLVPDMRPEPMPVWPSGAELGDEQQVQICRIVDQKTGQSANAEGLFYQLIVRLHKYSLGRVNHADSVHWQRGLVLDDDYNGRALLEHVGNDVRITVRAAYPERFLSVLTNEVKWLVENFWEGLRCEIMVPCVDPCGKKAPGLGLFEVRKLIESKRRSRPEYPCEVSGCNEWQSIDYLLRNAPAVRGAPLEALVAEGFDEMRSRLTDVRRQLNLHDQKDLLRFRKLDQNDRRIMSQVDDAFATFMQALTDEAKDGPRLFSFLPIEPGFFDRPKWISEKFRLTLWCEHSRLPLTELNGPQDRHGVYEFNLPRTWVVKAAPFLKMLTGTLSLVLPVASSATKLLLPEDAFKRIENELDFGQKCVESVLMGGEQVGSWVSNSDAPELDRGGSVRAQGAMLRELHAMLREKDPAFGNLVRVQNKRREFMWVHPQFVGKY